ncbi:Penicillin-binding protein 2D [bacterium HR40]|nr:Penicillin-binding protein 2D [bacterium HR40]
MPGLAAGLLILLAGGFALLLPDLPDPASLRLANRQARVTVLAADASLLDERADAGGPHLRLGEISPWLVRAVLAVEDRRFYSHFGFDLFGTARAAVRDLLAGDYVAGGSTITQQLAKNLYLGSERTLLRKLRELLLALWLEARLSKDEILELYLNRVYFGAGAYGAEAAARTYFGKPAHDLELAEAAMLAGLLKAPSRYAPDRDPAAARARAQVVLDAMVEAGFLDPQTAAMAKAQPARPMVAQAGFARHFVDRALDVLTSELGRPTDDRVVRTTLDPALQRVAREALRRRLARLPGAEGAVVVLDSQGAVRALVGGIDRRSPLYDRASLVRRQPGSAFKLFVYAAALANGRSPADIVEDEPLSIAGWSPRNIDGQYRGPVTLEQAFAESLNTVAVRLALETGLGRIAALAKSLGIESELRQVPSLALGTSEITPLELARAALALVTDGRARREYWIERVQDGAGAVLWQHAAQPRRVLDGRTIAALKQLLRTAVERGTGRAARIRGRTVLGKTGTSQEGRDGWFVGFDGSHLVVVWVGRDDYRPVRGLTGGGVPAQIARDILAASPAPPVEIPPATPELDGAAALRRWLEDVFGR